jgi:arabinogalactan endo-1,4-beta-galactosidase
MIDFHCYSIREADPAKQFKPKSMEKLHLEELKNDVLQAIHLSGSQCTKIWEVT